MTENHSNGPESFLKHYVAIYDPTRALLEVVPARRSFVQSTLRPLAAEAQLDAQEDEEASNVSRHYQLQLARQIAYQKLTLFRPFLLVRN